MKKVFTFLLILSIFIGCSNINNTPTRKVEEFLNKYQTLSSDVLKDLEYSIESNNFTEEQKNSYREIMKKQYKDLTYTIKDEEVDGDNATVKVEIEVYNFNNASTIASNYFMLNQDEFLNPDGVVDESKYTDYKLEEMEKITDRVKYTIEFNVKKKDDVWVLDSINDEIREKIHGLYSY